MAREGLRRFRAVFAGLFTATRFATACRQSWLRQASAAAVLILELVVGVVVDSQQAIVLGGTWLGHNPTERTCSGVISCIPIDDVANKKEFGVAVSNGDLFVFAERIGSIGQGKRLAGNYVSRGPFGRIFRWHGKRLTAFEDVETRSNLFNLAIPVPLFTQVTDPLIGLSY
jgi:hypothetical protein